jgi:pimeloyl-ACP methyl ester carboxylesterase
MRLLFAAAALLLASVDSSSAYASGISGWQIRYFSPDNAWSHKQLMHRLAFCVAMAVLLAGGWTHAANAQAANLSGFGIVMMHGKGGGPEGLIAPLVSALKDNGAMVSTPIMPWHGKHGRPDGYMETFDQAMQKITGSVSELKLRGATKIVVAGHSLGANAALAYAVRNGRGLAGIMMLAPGHTPELVLSRVQPGVAKAKELAAAGRGDTATTLPDFNQGQQFQVRAKPAAYLSFFDPHGPAVMSRNAAAIPPLPLLWVIGRSDPLFARGEGYAYARAPKHAKSKYVIITANHRDTPEAARQEVITWLKSL